MGIFLVPLLAAKKQIKQDMEDLKKRISDLIEKEHCSGSMDAISPLYVSRMLNVPLEEVEKCLKEMEI